MPSQHISIPYGSDRQRVLNVLAQRRYRQRKRERLHFLETTLRATNTTAMHDVDGELRLQQPRQPPLPGSCNLSPDISSNPSKSQCQGFKTGTADTQFMYLAPHGAVCNSSGLSSSYFADQPESNTIQPLGNSAHNVVSMSNSYFSTEFQDLETSLFTFPSEHLINIPTLKTMEASLRIAHMLGIGDELLDLTISRVFDVSKMLTPWGDLPENFRPTEAQLLLPHYPAIDVLPWPSVRTKLICLFSQPDQLRPPIARGTTSILRLLHDLDDESEGLRIDSEVNVYEYDVKNWEIGQAIFKDWWWAFDSEIISNSDRLRRRRGAPRLQLPGL